MAGQVYNRFLAGATALPLDRWQSFWWLPAAFAAVVLVFFALAFNDRSAEAERVRRQAGVGAQPMAPPA